MSHDGGQAFPSVEISSQKGFDPDSPSSDFTSVSSETVGGMTLRDYLEAKAMAALLVNIERLFTDPSELHDRMATIAWVSRAAADAMLEMREGQVTRVAALEAEVAAARALLLVKKDAMLYFKYNPGVEYGDDSESSLIGAYLAARRRTDEVG